MQRLAHLPGVVASNQSITDEPHDPSLLRLPEAIDLLQSATLETDAPGHGSAPVRLIKVERKFLQRIIELNEFRPIAQTGFRKIGILQIIDMLKDRLTGVKALGSARQLGNPVKALLDLRRQSKCKHG